MSRRNRNFYSEKLIVIDSNFLVRLWLVIYAIVVTQACLVGAMLEALSYSNFLASSSTSYHYYGRFEKCSDAFWKTIRDNANKPPKDWIIPDLSSLSTDEASALEQTNYYFPLLLRALGIDYGKYQPFIVDEISNLMVSGEFASLALQGDDLTFQQQLQHRFQQVIPVPGGAKIEIITDPVTVKGLGVEELRDDYPVECFDGVTTPKCYADNPICDLPCPAGTPCDPSKAELYCMKHQGCVDLGNDTFECGNSAMHVSTMTAFALIGTVATVLLAFVM